MTNSSGHDCGKCKLGRKTFGDWYYCNGNSCEMKVRADERAKVISEMLSKLRPCVDEAIRTMEVSHVYDMADILAKYEKKEGEKNG